MSRVFFLCVLVSLDVDAKPRRFSKAELEKIIATVPARPSRVRRGVTQAMVDAWYQALTPRPQQAVDQYCAVEENGFSITCGGTPLVVSFGPAPVKLVAPGAFAFTPGFPTTTLWPSVETPWLGRDLDGSGCIETGAELFGSNTRLSDGTLAPDGFAALRELDSNQDGVLDARDPGFSTLVLWSNEGDRQCHASELTPLWTRMTSISLSTTKGTSADEVLRSTMQWRDARGTHEGYVIDLFLRERVTTLTRRSPSINLEDPLEPTQLRFQVRQHQVRLP